MCGGENLFSLSSAVKRFICDIYEKNLFHEEKAFEESSVNFLFEQFFFDVLCIF
jgi:hypothetical protein